ncbi:hypothetical protein [Demequina litorisediminis]|uniref:hypothetical protein n=1 Tax=Demequina litorisediminis TaxID=1849022 RepID=UPI0032AF7EC0
MLSVSRRTACCVCARRSWRTRVPSLPEVDLGGGYAIAYTEDAEALEPAVAAYEIADAVASVMDPIGGQWPRFSIEPGRAIAGPAGLTLYSVGVTKDVKARRGWLPPVRRGGRRHERQPAHHHVWRAVSRRGGLPGVRCPRDPVTRGG